MTMNRNKRISGIVLCLIFCIESIQPDICEREEHLSVIWDSYNNVSIQEIQGDPMCLNEFKMNVFRKCHENGWLSEKIPHCHYTQKSFEKSESCPLNYATLKKQNHIHLCILLTEPKPWQNACINDGSSLSFYHLDEDEQKELLKILYDQNVTEIWMPAKRFTRYGPVIWTTAGELSGEQVEFDKLNVDLIDDNYVAANGCFSAFVQSNLTAGSVRNCNQKLNILCMFRQNTEHTALVSLACPRNGFTVPYYSSEQYCHSIQMVDKSFLKSKTNDIEKIKDECKGDLFTMDSAQKIEIFQQLASLSGLRYGDRCLFAVAHGNIYVTNLNDWKSKIDDIKFVNWDHPIANGSFLTTNKNGKWNWIDRPFDCLVCSMPIKIYEPELVLNFDKKKRRLYLTVYNEEFLSRSVKLGVKCFTNADDELVKTVEIGRKKWSSTLSMEQINRKPHYEFRLRKKSKAIYELKLYGEGPGYYWCEGYTMLQFDMIQSTKVVAFRRERGEVFATLINTMCKDCGKFFYKNFIKNYAKQFREHLKDANKMLKKSDEFLNSFANAEINIENVRIMQIEDISPKKTDTGMYRARVLCHLTISLHTYDDVNEYSRIMKIREMLEKLLQRMPFNQEYEFVSLNSTDYCSPESNQTSNGLSWFSAKIGETIPPNELCLLSNGLPALRSCVGDFLYGGIWQYTSQQECLRKPDHLTEKLFEFSNKMALSNQINDNAMLNISTLLQKNSQKPNNVVAADLFYLGRIMSDFSRLNNKNSINTATNLCDTEHVFSIYNNLMYLNENTTRKSAALNSTNILLDAFDNILNGIQIDITSLANNRNNNDTIVVNSADGTITTQTPNLIVYVIDPSIKSVSGVALMKKSQRPNDESNDFTDYYIKTLYANQSSDELLNDNKLEIATFVPTTLLNAINSTANETEDSAPWPIKIIISIYYNDRLFQEYRHVRRAKSTGRIISVSIPGYGPNLPALLPIFVRSRSDLNETGSMCGYWNFENEFASWSDDGCEFIGKSLNKVDPVVLCACSHLTHYSYLIVGTVFQPPNAEEDEVIITNSHQKALDMITLLGCLLSLMGICGITITAIFFRTWRKKPSSIVLLQLSAAIALQMILLCFVNTEYSSMYLIMEQRFIVCVALGALLQYSILVAFSWMLITAYLQFMRYVIVLGPQRTTRFFLKSFLIGWGSPLIPVLIVVFASPDSYVQSVGNLNSGGICYPSGASLYFGLILPIGIIMSANLIIFIIVIYNILVGPGANMRSNKRTLLIAQLRLSVFLFFLLGLSWIFGFLATIKSGIIFSYLFCLTATIQGFILFVYFIILDSNTRKLWRNFLFKTL